MAPRTFDQEAFLLPPATRMLLATRRNPAAGHGRQLISTPSILFTQARIKHVETDDLPQGRFGRPHGRAHLFRARRGAAQNRQVTTVTGPLAESGRYQIQGAKLAVEEINKAGGLLGRPIELIIEDNQTTNPGVVLAFSNLAADKDIAAFIGPNLSTQVHAMAPDIQRTGRPVMIGGTDPQLTHMDNPWLFRCRPNDIYSARVIADYGVNTLGKKKWAIVHSTDAFGTADGKALASALDKLGDPAVLDQGYANQSQDFPRGVLAVKQSGADILGTYFTFENDLGIFARQL